MKRPTPPRLYATVWRDEGENTPGFALRGGCGHVVGHLTADEARIMADALHDAAERLDRFEETGHLPQDPKPPRYRNPQPA